MKWKITESSDVALLLLALGEWIKSDCPCYCEHCEAFRIACRSFRYKQRKTDEKYRKERQ